MPTTFTFSASESSGPSQETPLSFDYPFAYENRLEIRTSRWLLTGVNTRSAGNTDRGWLYLQAARDGQSTAVELFKDPACGADSRVATGSADLSGIDSAAARCVLQADRSSGLAGEFYFEHYAADPSGPVAVLVSLCVDDDLRDEYQNLDDLGDGVNDPQTGLARFCAAATRKTLLLAGQQFAAELGGFGAPEHRSRLSAGRTVPDYRRLANPDQLKEAAVHWALMLAFGSCHERAGATMYSQLRDYHDQKRKDAIGAWSLALVGDPDNGGQANQHRSVGARYINRL